MPRLKVDNFVFSYYLYERLQQMLTSFSFSETKYNISLIELLE